MREYGVESRCMHHGFIENVNMMGFVIKSKLLLFQFDSDLSKKEKKVSIQMELHINIHRVQVKIHKKLPIKHNS